MKPTLHLLLLLFPLLVAAAMITDCAGDQHQNASDQVPLTADPQATPETRALFRNLDKIRHDHVLFAHQDALAYGVHWIREPGRSDVRDVTGSYPAVYGWELGHIEHGAEENLDAVNFSEMQQWIREGYERGGVITISWHPDNPVSGGSAWDTTPAVPAVLPGGAEHDKFVTWLDRLADFLLGLQVESGEMIPVIFRPWHEMNGSWFWWGRDFCSPEEFHEFWRFTVEYLRDERGLRHLLYAYSTDRFVDEEDYMERYPGDEWVDVMGYDDYGTVHSSDTRDEFVRQLETVVTLAGERGKIPALTESGYNMIPDESWWTDVYLAGINATETTRQIAWALVWRNANHENDRPDHYFVPYAGHSSAENFIEFRNHPLILFEDDLPDMYR